MRLLGRWECVKVETIVISKTGCVYLAPRLWVQEWLRDNPSAQWEFVKLSADEKDSLAKADGFQGGFSEMVQFWDGRLPFIGHVIHWAFHA